MTTLSTAGFPGYRDLELLHRGTRTLVHRGIRVEDERPVVLKSATPGTAETNRRRWALQREYQVLESLELPGLLHVYGLISTPFGTTLEMEDVGAQSLASLEPGEVSLQTFLTIALQLARTVSGLHEQRIVHRDISPNNVLYRANIKQVWLIDFDQALHMSSASAGVEPTSLPEGTLGYLSPEQTGRVNRLVDYRTDLYSLGATLYRVLTGRPPFDVEDRLQALHATMALEPPPIARARPDVPDVVQDILSRLLAKDASERYQSAAALVDDLTTCHDNWKREHAIPSFPLSSTDRRGHFLLPERLYGREEALATLEHMLRSARAGEPTALGVCGPTGVGKTALVSELVSMLDGKGILAPGKCDQLRRTPYAPVLQLLRFMTGVILSRSQASIDRWRERLAGVTGGRAALVTRLLPELQGLLGAHSDELTPLEPDARKRLPGMLLGLVRALHREEEPLVVFLDDLQWADQGTLTLLERLLAESHEAPGPLVVLAWRNDEVPPEHPLARMLARLPDGRVDAIELAGLEPRHIAQLLSDVLAVPGHVVEQLAECIHRKTAGNAFFVRQFLHGLYRDELLHYDSMPRRWVWSVKQVEEQAVTANVVSLLLRRIQELPELVQEILSVAACIGGTVSVRDVQQTSGRELSTVENAIFSAVEAGLLVSAGRGMERLAYVGERVAADGVPEQVVFVHDSVQRAAYELLPPEQRQQTHLRVGRMLLADWHADEREVDPFAMADQLNRASELLTDPEERRDVAAIELLAGQTALDSAAFEAAASYLEVGIQLMDEGDWQQHYDLLFPLYLKAADALLMCPERTPTIDYLAVARQRARTALDRVAAQRVAIRKHAGRYEYTESMDLTLEALRWVGVPLPAQPRMRHFIAALLRTQWRVRGMDSDKLRALPDNRDPHVAAAMQLLLLTVPAFQTASLLLPLMILRLVDLSIQNGVSAASSYGFAGYAFMLGAQFKVDDAVVWSGAAREIVERFDAREFAPRVELMSLGHVEARRLPLSSVIDPWLHVSQLGKEAGDAEFAAFGIVFHCVYSLQAGVGLELLLTRVDNGREAVRKLDHEWSIDHLSIMRQLIACLVGEAEDPADLGGEHLDYRGMLTAKQEAGDRAGAGNLLLVHVWLQLLFADNRAALAAVEEAQAYLDALPGSPDVPPFHLHAGLIWIQRAREVRGERRRCLRKVRRQLSQLRKWARHGAMNHQHKIRLLEAEMHDLAGDMGAAASAYDEAIALARSSGMLHEEALCLEWAARAELRWGRHRSAASLLDDARATWRAWGCTTREHILDGLQEQLPSLYRPATADTSSTSELPDSLPMDVASVLKASRAISSEIVLDRLLERLMAILIENAGARKCALFLFKDDELFVPIDARVTRDGDGEQVACALQSTPLEEYEDAPREVVQLVARSGDTIILDGAEDDSRFATSSYLQKHKPRSALCAPLSNQGKVLAVVYLENRLVAGVYNQERLAVLRVLSSQIAISLENALLYREIEQRVRDRTSELQQRNVELRDAMGELQTTQNQLIHSEKQASMGRLTMGIAHEIKNPLNFINNFSRLLVEIVDELDDAMVEQDDAEAQAEVVAIMEDLKANAGQIHEHGKRANDIVQSMLRHVSSGTGKRRELELNDLVDSCVRIARHGTRSQQSSMTVAITHELDPAVGRVAAVAGDLTRVVVNLIDNALDAVLARKQAQPVGYEPAVHVSTKAGDNQVTVAVRDNGDGMTREVLERIFEPFFTTKEPGQGTGLGLSLSYDVVVNGHGGALSAESEPGRGATFHITLPRAPEQVLQPRGDG